MKAGMVSSIRINTKDCLAILDLMNVVGIDPYDGRSFASCVSLAISSLIEVARNSSIIKKEEDGFQFLNRMQPFLAKGNDRMKRKLADAMHKRAAEGIAAPSLLHAITLPAPTIKAGWQELEKENAAKVMPLDEETKALLFDELQELNERKNNREELSQNEEDRYLLLTEQLGY